MSGTMANIGVLYNSNGQQRLTSILCWYDGYIKNAGRLLVTNFNTESSALELVQGGDVVGLRQEIHRITKYAANSESREWETVNQFLEWSNSDYCYLMSNGVWHVRLPEMETREMVNLEHTLLLQTLTNA